MTCGRFHVVGTVGVVLALVLCSPAFAQERDPHQLLAEADRLAWLRVWTRAEPLYAEAREAFAPSGDRRMPSTLKSVDCVVSCQRCQFQKSPNV